VVFKDAWKIQRPLETAPPIKRIKEAIVDPHARRLVGNLGAAKIRMGNASHERGQKSLTPKSDWRFRRANGGDCLDKRICLGSALMDYRVALGLRGGLASLRAWQSGSRSVWVAATCFRGGAWPRGPNHTLAATVIAAESHGAAANLETGNLPKVPRSYEIQHVDSLAIASP